MACRDWYQVLLPLLYRSARLEIAKVKSGAYQLPELTLKQAIDNGRQRYVRHLWIGVDMVDRGSYQTPAPILRSCGQLPAVTGVYIFFYPNFSSAVRAFGREDASRLASRVVSSFGALMGVASKRLPNVRHIAVTSVHAYERAMAVDPIELQLAEKAGTLIGAQATKVALQGCAMVEKVLALGLRDSMRSIALRVPMRMSRSLELVRRNSGSLERLIIDSRDRYEFDRRALDVDVPASIFIDRVTRKTIVYPRLRSLHVYGRSPGASRKPIQLLANPVPSLEALRLGRCRTFPAAFVLLENRARLRLLDVVLTRDIVRPLMGDSVVKESGFPSLTHVVLEQFYEKSENYPDPLTYKLMELLGRSPRLESMDINGYLFAEEDQYADYSSAGSSAE
ncbi:hypothetical protein H4R18_003053 [Coemansia javaensis]|uniref:Uncharacterized protein n=1 Tax=Coemansia javaensis TaxID=2761396 RepID=A0A9W8H814_9FUNG|nr:hypothetical protein H4R18_003053 [Coemansia javaensis]